MSETRNLESIVKSHPVILYGTAFFLGFGAALGVVQAGMSLLGKTLVSADEIRQNEKTQADFKQTTERLTRELESARAAAQGTASNKEGTAELERRIRSLDTENARLRLDLRSAIERADAGQAARRSELSSPATSFYTSPQSRPVADSPALSKPPGSAPTPVRQSFELKAGTPAVIDQSLTITLNYTRSYGGQFVINGQKRSYQSVGTRIDVSAAIGKKCFLEVMTLSSETAEPNTAKLDYVCPAKS